MSDAANNTNPLSSDQADAQAAHRLSAVEGDGIPEDLHAKAMHQDRNVLQAALKADLARPLSRQLSARFEQASRDEIDRALLANLATGRSLEDHLPVSKVIPVRPSMFAGVGRAWQDLRLSRGFAAAALLAMVAGVVWLAMRSSAPSTSSPVAAKPSELPQWAVLPDRPAIVPQASTPSTPETKDDAIAAVEVRETRDLATALDWARRGILAIRLVSDSPRRDHERLTTIVSDTKKRAWQIAASSPVGLAAIPSNPWPIDQTLVDADAKSIQTASSPSTATIAAFDGTLRPEASVLQALREELERDLSCTVVFERVDELARYSDGTTSDNAPSSASDVLWWTKPSGEWNLRVHVPVVLEFGSRGPAK